MTKPEDRRLTLAELQYLDAQISLAQERGIGLDDSLVANKDISCCGAIAANARGNLIFSEHDREIFRQIVDLEGRVEAMPTLRQLIDARGKLLREANARHE
jgi:hypothetical protein